MSEVAFKGKGDWDEGKYWLEKIIQFCRSRGWTYLVVPVPYEPVLLGKRKAGHYPGTISNVLEESSLTFLDPSDDLLNAHLELVVAGERVGKRPYGCPLFNVQIRRRPLLSPRLESLGPDRGPAARRSYSRGIRRSRRRNTDGMISLRGNQRVGHSLSRRRPMRQRVFAFVERAERLDRTFKLVIALATVGSIAFFLTALSPGRYLSSWVAARTRWLARQAVGLPPDRGEIDADWKRKRLFDIEQSRGTLAGTFAEYSPALQRLLEYAGLDPDHALVRWGNFDRTVLLPSTVFEPDETGRSYRFRPNMRSIWVRNFPMKGPVKAYFQVPDTARAPRDRERNGGPDRRRIDPDDQFVGPARSRARSGRAWRGIVLGDSYMQGLFVGDRRDAGRMPEARSRRPGWERRSRS